MREYTFLFLNPDHYAVRFMTLDCLTDEGAMEIAHAIAARHHVEVWHHARFVGSEDAVKAQEPDFGTPIDETPAPASERPTPAPQHASH